MPAVRYLVPYEVVIVANDIGSGKLVTNTLYYRTATATGAAPAYGASLPGSSLFTLLDNIRIAWFTHILNLLNHNYKLQFYQARAIVGKRYKSPFEPITGLVPGAPIGIFTGVPHHLATGDLVNIVGVGSPTAVNTVWRVTVVDPNNFTLNGSNNALPWSGDGMWQDASGPLQFEYADKEVINSAAVGAVSGDALPLFASASVRRINSGVGKNFRSRISLGPMSESDSLDGGLLPARVTAINDAFVLFNVGIVNGGTDVGAGLSYNIAVSKKLASGQVSPFPSYGQFTALVSSFIVQRNLGSMVRRKPRLTSVIT